MGASPLTMYNILNYNLGSQAYSPGLPATYYVGLSTATIAVTAATGLGTVVEPLAASGYARVTYTNDTSTGWTTATTSAGLSNKTAITFTQSSASWGTVVGIFLADSATRAAGNVWWYAALTPTLAVQSSVVVSFGIGTVIFTMV